MKLKMYTLLSFVKSERLVIVCEFSWGGSSVFISSM